MNILLFTPGHSRSKVWLYTNVQYDTRTAYGWVMPTQLRKWNRFLQKNRGIERPPNDKRLKKNVIFTTRPNISWRKKQRSNSAFQETRIDLSRNRKSKKMGLQQLFTGNNKKVVPKRELFQILSQVHSRILTANSKVRKVASRNYAEISQKVVNTSIPCTQNAQQPMEAPTFLSLIEIDLM